MRLRVFRDGILPSPWVFEITARNGRVIFGSYGIPSQPEALRRGLWVLKRYLLP